MGIGNLAETWAVATGNWGWMAVAIVIGVIVGWIARSRYEQASRV